MTAPGDLKNRQESVRLVVDFTYDKDGPTLIPAPTTPMYLPRSALVDISATTAYPKANVPLLPPLWTMRRIKRAAKLF